MLCYADKTFCGYNKECKKGDTCTIALTIEIRSKCRIWAEENNLPELISVYTTKPKCFEEKDDDKYY